LGVPRRKASGSGYPLQILAALLVFRSYSRLVS